MPPSRTIRLRAGSSWIRRSIAPLILVGSTSCATGDYAGIDLRPGAAPTELQNLAMQARSGDKEAQLALGTRYELGEGLPVDLSRARTLYTAAAKRSGGTIYVYSPPVGRNRRGQVIPVNAGPVLEGLPEAQARLAGLKKRGSRR